VDNRASACQNACRQRSGCSGVCGLFACCKCAYPKRMLAARVDGFAHVCWAARSGPLQARLRLYVWRDSWGSAGTAPARLCFCTRPRPRRPAACARRRPWRPAIAAAAPAPSPAAEHRGHESDTRTFMVVLKTHRVPESVAKPVSRNGVVGEGGIWSRRSVYSGRAPTRVCLA